VEHEVNYYRRDRVLHDYTLGTVGYGRMQIHSCS
jgi:hypothetical protein